MHAACRSRQPPRTALHAQPDVVHLGLKAAASSECTKYAGFGALQRSGLGQHNNGWVRLSRVPQRVSSCAVSQAGGVQYLS